MPVWVTSSGSLLNVNGLRSYQGAQLLLSTGQEQFQAAQASLADDLVKLFIHFGEAERERKNTLS